MSFLGREPTFLVVGASPLHASYPLRGSSRVYVFCKTLCTLTKVSSSTRLADRITLDHGIRGLLVRYVGWWLILIIGLVAMAVLPLALVLPERRNALSWSRIAELLGWLVIGGWMAWAGWQLFRVRRSLTKVIEVDGAGITVKSKGGMERLWRWGNFTSVRIDPLMTHIELAAPTLADPIYLVNGAAPRWRFRMLWDIAQREAGPVVEVAKPSMALRAAAIVFALGIAPGVIYRLFNGELLGSLLMLAVAAFLVYAGLTGLPRLYRKKSE